MQALIECSDDNGVVSFDWADAPYAPPGVLTMRAEAPDEEGLRRVQHLVTDHIERSADAIT